MYRILLVLLSIVTDSHSGNINMIKLPESNSFVENLVTTSCVSDIIQRNNTCGGEITVVNFGVAETRLLKQLEEKECFTFVTREFLWVNLTFYHQSYIVYVEDENELRDGLNKLSLERFWNPSLRTVVILNSYKNLTKAFEILLSHMIINSVVVSQSENESKIYTYFPYHEFNCGKTFKKIEKMGTCGHIEGINFFPDKLPTGLKNCTLDFVTQVFPPWIFSQESNTTGVEQLYVSLLAKIEEFRFNFIYHPVPESETFGELLPNFTATNLLREVQLKNADCLACCMTLSANRLRGFDFIYPHTNENFILIVPSADVIPLWKSIYLEFKYKIWILIFVSYALYSMLVMKIKAYNSSTRQPIEVSLTLFNLLGYLVGNVSKIRQKYTPTRIIIITWVLFAMFVSYAYQSMMISILYNPVKDYQVSSYDDIVKHKLKPCLGNPLRPHIQELEYVKTLIDAQNVSKDCASMIKGLEGVANRTNLFTITPKNYYTYRVEQFTDEKEMTTTYDIKEPLYSFSNVLFCNKGFPIMNELDYDSIWIRSSGLLKKQLADVFYTKRLRRKRNPVTSTIAFTLTNLSGAFFLLFLGHLCSFGLFLCELSCRKRLATSTPSY